MAEAQLELYVLALPGIRGGDILDNTFPYGDYVVNYYDLGDGIILYSYGKSKPQEDSVTVTEKERGYTYVPKTAPSDELLFWGDIAAVSIISGTLLEDFFTGGIGIADDAACFWLAYELMKN